MKRKHAFQFLFSHPFRLERPRPGAQTLRHAGVGVQGFGGCAVGVQTVVACTGQSRSVSGLLRMEFRVDGFIGWKVSPRGRGKTNRSLTQSPDSLKSYEQCTILNPIAEFPDPKCRSA